VDKSALSKRGGWKIQEWTYAASRASCVRTCSDCPLLHCPLPQCPPLPYRADKSTDALSTPANSAFPCRRQSSSMRCILKVIRSRQTVVKFLTALPPEYRHSHVRHTRRQLRQLSSLGRRAVDQQKSLLFQSPDPAQQRSVVVHQLQHKLHRIPEKKKGDTKLMAVTLLVLVRFSKFFHCQILL